MRHIIWYSSLLLVVVLLIGCSGEKSATKPGSNQGGAPAKTDNASAQPPKDTTKPEAAGKSKQKDSGAPEMELKMIGRKVTLAWQDGGKPKLKTTADEWTGNTISGKTYMKHVHADLYDNGKLAAKLTAPLVEADESTRIITATGGVTITSMDPKSSIKVIKSEWIKWYSKDNVIKGDGGISAKGPMAFIEAAAFEADTMLHNVKVTSGASEGRAVIGKP